VDSEAWKAIAAEHEAVLEKSKSALDYDPGSNKQVAERILAEGHRLPKTDKGNWSVDADALERLKDKSQTVREVLEYRSSQKFAGTYGRKFLDFVEPDGRVHAEFNLVGAETGRLSSDHPNLQSIPRRDPVWGPRYRRAFAPARGNVYVKADYVQQELYILAEVSRDELMVQDIRDKVDLHRRAVSQALGIPMEDVTKEQRDAIGKPLNFGIAYGKSAGTLALDLGVSRKEAQAFLDRHFGSHPGITAYKLRQERPQDYVTTLTGRRFWLNPHAGKHSQNNALNAPIQGTAAAMFERAIAKMHQRWPKMWGTFGLCLLVHDEVVVEVSRCHARACKRLVRECALEAEAELLPSVPPAADVEIVKNWWGDK
jgi:DNA polymerase-1